MATVINDKIPVGLPLSFREDLFSDDSPAQVVLRHRRLHAFDDDELRVGGLVAQPLEGAYSAES